MLFRHNRPNRSTRSATPQASSPRRHALRGLAAAGLTLAALLRPGLAMADVYRGLPRSWWLHYPGALILVKVGVIVALIVVFITCPLFRQCSPVRGVCNINDLRQADQPTSTK